jgi:hypothetical protein
MSDRAKTDRCKKIEVRATSSPAGAAPCHFGERVVLTLRMSREGHRIQRYRLQRREQRASELQSQ